MPLLTFPRPFPQPGARAPGSSHDNPSLRFYARLARIPVLGYRAKFLTVAFLGTHVPLIVLALWYGFRVAVDWSQALMVLGVTLGATLVGAICTLLSLHGLLQPVAVTSRALRAYREGRQLPDLPLHFEDEAGTLMADAQETMRHLDAALVTLERFDNATGLLNRVGFARAIEGREGTGAVAVVRLLDHGRLVEAFDQRMADQVMAVIGERLRLEGMRELARIGPSDLAFVMDAPLGTAPQREAAAFDLRALVATAGAEVRVEDKSLMPLLRGGLAAREPGTDPESAIGDAVAALGEANPQMPVVIHSEVARERARDRFLIEEELRRALARDEFVLHFQPVMDLAQGRAVSAEALIRWQSPDRGMVPPGVFIPVAEASGLIDEIGLWTLDAACRTAATLDPALRIAVNLGARQFADPALAQHVGGALSRAGLPARRLEIELTETVAMADSGRARRAMHDLAEMGVRIAIDDFGTGYASMNYLRQLPFHKLKIDRAFVSEIDASSQSRAICAAVVALGDGLGLDVVAEGAERAEEVAVLDALGCKLFQGFYFARPVPACDLTAAIAGLSATEETARQARG